MSVRYNERSWAIDVISQINLISGTHQRVIRRAGGEASLQAGQAGTLFPDVLLFGGTSSSVILQGWELKMPDTPITDQDLLSNAESKARLLGLNSFLVWNVTSAQLYVLDTATDIFSPYRSWNDLSHVQSRVAVQAHQAQWIQQLQIIIADLNDFLESGVINTVSLYDVFDRQTMVELILHHKTDVGAEIQQAAIANTTLNAQVNAWWQQCHREYLNDETSQFTALAKVNLLSWMNRILFAHWLKRIFTHAREIEQIIPGTNITNASAIIQRITQQCDFLNIFQPMICETVLTARAWDDITALNSFLTDLRVDSIEQSILQSVLERTIVTSRRELVGQYATPPALANLLVSITVRNWNHQVYDPCCGTGTIAKAVLERKRVLLNNPVTALSSTWASDKFAFPLQIANIALSNPDSACVPVNLFRADVFDMNVGNTQNIIDPSTGQSMTCVIPSFPCIVSNLPFVAFENIRQNNPGIDSVNTFITNNLDSTDSLTDRSDVFAYITIKLWQLLPAEGRLGIIISNSWLGTEWGRNYRRVLNQFYHVRQVLVSGNGRWFSNADIVTTITILEKKATPRRPIPTESISFSVLRQPISELENPTIQQRISDQLILGNVQQTQDLSTYTLSHQEIDFAERHGLEWSTFFTDMSWFSSVAPLLLPLTNFFDIARGERRGWDPMFYPAPGHCIEPQYLRPVLKSPRSISGFIATPNDEAFCCSREISELIHDGHTGALSWINRFAAQTNETGKPLPQVLARTNQHWYEMNDSTTADLVAFMNYDERIFIARMNERGFVNQRLIRMTACNNFVDIDLCHALLNSIVGIFYLEAMGFGRGLAALDISATKIKNGFRILDPTIPNPAQRAAILQSFANLCNREPLKMHDEMVSPDRIAFDQTILGVYGLSAYYFPITEAFQNLYNIRRTART